MHDLIIENNEIKGVEVKPSAYAFDDEYASEKIYADKVVLSVGRKGAAWLTKMCESHGIEQKTGPVDIGIRYELPDEIMKDINKYLLLLQFLKLEQLYYVLILHPKFFFL